MHTLPSEWLSYTFVAVCTELHISNEKSIITMSPYHTKSSVRQQYLNHTSIYRHNAYHQCSQHYKQHYTDQSASVLELHSISQAPGISTRPGRWGSDDIHTGQSCANNESSAALCYTAESSVHTSAFSTLITRHSRHHNTNLSTALHIARHWRADVKAAM